MWGLADKLTLSKDLLISCISWYKRCGTWQSILQRLQWICWSTRGLSVSCLNPCLVIICSLHSRSTPGWTLFIVFGSPSTRIDSCLFHWWFPGRVGGFIIFLPLARRVSPPRSVRARCFLDHLRFGLINIKLRIFKARVVGITSFDTMALFGIILAVLCFITSASTLAFISWIDPFLL